MGRTVHPRKDPDAQHRVPTAWRPRFHAIAAAFAAGDFGLKKNRIPGVAPVSAGTVKSIRWNVAGYGESLADLPSDTWESSVCQWIGPHWEVLVDLWTESGPSDLVLHAMVRPAGRGYRIEIHLVYVP